MYDTAPEDHVEPEDCVEPEDRAALEPPFLSTGEFARLLGIQPESLRKSVYRYGHYFGIKPERRHNNRLGWPREPAMRLVYGKRSPGGERAA